jgi:hypothetical protein
VFLKKWRVRGEASIFTSIINSSPFSNLLVSSKCEFNVNNFELVLLKRESVEDRKKEDRDETCRGRYCIQLDGEKKKCIRANGRQKKRETASITRKSPCGRTASRRRNNPMHFKRRGEEEKQKN